MPGKVIDASALAAAAFEEPEGDRIGQLLEDSELSAPTLLLYEINNVASQKIRRFPEKQATLERLLSRIDELDITYLNVDHEAVLSLALDTGLTTYDASYLWLARALNADLVTLDQQLQRAADATS
jgi:predicted nucleic acid-binding protein